jgi:hypothetical protein
MSQQASQRIDGKQIAPYHVLAGAPTTTDDAAHGFLAGHVYSSGATTLYFCTTPTTNAATWIGLDQSLLTTGSPSFAAAKLTNGSYATTISSGTLAGNISLTLPATAGTLALATLTPSLTSVGLTNSGHTATVQAGTLAGDITVSLDQSLLTTDSPTFSNVTATNYVYVGSPTVYGRIGPLSALGGPVQWNFQPTTGTVAFLTDLPTQAVNATDSPTWNGATLKQVNATDKIPLYFKNSGGTELGAIGYVGTTNDWLTGSAVGDICARVATGKYLRLGSGTRDILDIFDGNPSVYMNAVYSGAQSQNIYMYRNDAYTINGATDQKVNIYMTNGGGGDSGVISWLVPGLYLWSMGVASNGYFRLGQNGATAHAWGNLNGFSLAPDGAMFYRGLAYSSVASNPIHYNTSSLAIYYYTSDERVKKNIVPSKLNTSIIFNIDLFDFQMKELSDGDEAKKICESDRGVHTTEWIAQRMPKELVNLDDEGVPMSPKEIMVTMCMLEELKKLRAEVDILKSR